MSVQHAIGARVKFRDDHPDYPGMVGTVEDDITIPGGEPMVGVRLDSVPATADEIEPFDDAEEERGAALALAYRDRMAAHQPLAEGDQQAIHNLLHRDAPAQPSSEGSSRG